MEEGSDDSMMEEDQPNVTKGQFMDYFKNKKIIDSPLVAGIKETLKVSTGCLFISNV